MHSEKMTPLKSPQELLIVLQESGSQPRGVSKKEGEKPSPGAIGADEPKGEAQTFSKEQ